MHLEEHPEGPQGAGDDELGAALARADLAARWFLRSGLRGPSAELHRATGEALDAAEALDAPR